MITMHRPQPDARAVRQPQSPAFELSARNFEIRSTQRQIGNGPTKTAVLGLQVLQPLHPIRLQPTPMVLLEADRCKVEDQVCEAPEPSRCAIPAMISQAVRPIGKTH